MELGHVRSNHTGVETRQSRGAGEDRLMLTLNFAGLTIPEDVADIEESSTVLKERTSFTAGADKPGAPIEQNFAFDAREFNLSTDLAAKLLLRLLQENDNSDNAFDDSHYISKLLTALGSLQNFEHMPLIAQEIEKHLLLDGLGQNYTKNEVSRGCIRAYFKMRKQIYTYKQFKRPYFDQNRCREELLKIEE